MKYILILLLLISFAGFGQGKKVAVFDPASNSYVYLYVYESNNPQTTIANPTFTGTVALPSSAITNTMLSGSIAASKLIGSDIVLTESQVTNLVSDLGLKAPLLNPTFTGTVTLPALTVTNGMLAGSIAYSKLNLTGGILNADLAGSIAYSKLSLTGAILNADLAGSIAYSKLLLSGAILNTDLAGSIAESKVTNLTTDLAAKQGVSVAATSATTGTITTPMTSATQTVYTITPTGACTFNATGGAAGAVMTFVITTSGTSSFVLTWGTNFKTTATLATGTTTAKTFSVSFVCTNGTQWVETGRTIAM